MNLIYSELNGRRWEGILLDAKRYQLRVMLPGAADVTELRCEYGQWYLENGVPVELEGMLTDASLGLGAVASELLGLTRKMFALPE